MKDKHYFKSEYSIFCHTTEYFKRHMKENGLKEIEVFEVIREIVGGGIFWCKKHEFCGGDSFDTCGRSNCKDYDPRNKISGVCKHHTHWLYSHGKKITIKL